ncbi:MAG: thiamine phosphate synthase [Planctomycetota bacterium]
MKPIFDDHSFDSADAPGILRTLDAAFQRLTEGLRSVEDPTRFHLQNQVLAGHWQGLRRKSGKLRQQLETKVGSLAPYRDLGGDPLLEASGMGKHASVRNMLLANLSRCRESARSIEELLRLIDADLSRAMQEIRYGIYAQQQVMEGLLQRGRTLEDRRLYVLVTESLCRGDLYETTAAALRGGASIVQLREKERPSGELLEIARKLRELTLEHDAVFLINDDVTVASLSGADGVHLGQQDLAPREARKILGPDAIIGLSTHCREQAAAAAPLGADYIGVGPIHETQTKEHREAVGPDYIRVAQEATPLPGYAIGRVDHTTIDRVMAAGADRVAVCTGIIAQEDPEAATRHLIERIEVGLDSTPPVAKPERESHAHD